MLRRCVKVGGSLLREPESLGGLFDILARTAPSSLVVTGSGPFLFVANELIARAGRQVASNIAGELLGASRGLTARVLACLTDAGRVVKDAAAVRAAADENLLPIADVVGIFGTGNEQCCGTDVHAARLCRELDLAQLVILTDVDGILDDTGNVIERMSTEELWQMGRTCVDVGVAEILAAHRIECVVLNGFFEDRVERLLLENGPVLGTVITAKQSQK